MLKIALFTISWMFSFISFSHPTQMGNIVGQDIQLQTIEHGFSGSIKNRLVMGYKKSGEFTSILKILEDDVETTSIFTRTEGENFGGNLVLRSGDKTVEYAIKFIKLFRDENKYRISFNGEVIDVYVSAESFANGHFINPKFSATYLGEQLAFKMQGQACYGYSLHLITMIMSAAIF